MNVVLFGHSYVRDLRRCRPWDGILSLRNGENVSLHYEFRPFPTRDFAYFLENPREVERIATLHPHVVVTVLGGNSIVGDISNSQIKHQAHEFFSLLRETVGPACVILAVQVEPRFVEAGNRFGAPAADEFNRRRQLINNYMNKTLKQKGFIDRMIILGSTNFMNNPANFSDGVHLTGDALLRYKDSIVNGIRYALERRG